MKFQRFLGLAGLLLLAGCKGGAPAGDAGMGGAGGGVAVAPVAAPAPVPLPHPQARVLRVVALGDSLLAGYGLTPQTAYPARLEAALRRSGVNASVVNAGVSGDTSEDGLARLDFALGKGEPPALVLISLGGNDALRGLPPAKTRDTMDALLAKLAARHIPAVVLGMMAPPNMGPDYARDFNAIFPDVAARHKAGLVPFFLAPVFNQPTLQLPDHIHPTAAGVEAMVAATLPVVRDRLVME